MNEPFLSGTARLARCTLWGALCCASVAQAADIGYSLTSLGGDLWRYEYTLDNTAGGVDFDEITVYFDVTNTLEIVSFSAPSGWNVDLFVAQPIPALSADGLVDAVHGGGLVAAGSVVTGFVVDFRYAAGLTPSAQNFELALSNPFAVVATGVTTAVPEPETYALMLLGLTALGLRARHAAGLRSHRMAKPTGDQA